MIFIDKLKSLHKKFIKDEDQTIRDIFVFGIYYTFILGLASLFLFGWWGAVQFLVIAVVMLLNFRWLKEIIDVITSRVEGKGANPVVIIKFVFRYLLIGLSLYAIISLRRPDVLPLLLGLSNMVAGVFGVAVKEACGKYRK